MRLVLMLTFGIAVASVLIFIAYGVVSLAKEEEELLTVVKEESLLLAKSVGVSVENALQQQEIDEIEQLLEQLEQVDPRVDLLVYRTSGELRLASAGSVARAEPERRIALAARDTSETLIELWPPHDPSQLLIGMRLMRDRAAGDERAAAMLVVTRPLAAVREDLERTRDELITSGILLAVLASLVGLTLGRVIVAKPLRQLLAAVRRARAGDLTPPDSRFTRGRDELAAVMGEFGVLVSELAAARRKLKEEASRRAGLERRLAEAERWAAIAELSVELAHEIGSPLQVVLGRAKALETRPPTEERVRHNARLIAEQCERIIDIVNQLLQMSREPQGKWVATLLDEPVSRVVELLRHEAERRGVDLHLTVEPPLPHVRCRPEQIQQVVLNLVVNAFDACRAGEAVTVGLRPVVGDGEPAVELTVRDGGVGIPPEALGRIFEPFFSQKQDGRGVGVGLSVVNRIVLDHKGKVTVASEVGRGTLFTVRLPAIASVT